VKDSVGAGAPACLLLFSLSGGGGGAHARWRRSRKGGGVLKIVYVPAASYLTPSAHA